MSYVLFDSPRRVEEYANEVPVSVLEAIAAARLAKQPPKYLVKGEWRYHDGRRFLDIAINRAWVDAATNNTLVDGRLRWTCPGCGKLSDTHAKGCEYR